MQSNGVIHVTLDFVAIVTISLLYYCYSLIIKTFSTIKHILFLSCDDLFFVSLSYDDGNNKEIQKTLQRRYVDCLG